jgi:tRNA pseudouridine55 synthase
MFGLINLYKPTGITSRQAIDPIERLVRPAKVGHAGTLDPLADGVLLVTVGPATRLTKALHTWPKSYRATFLLGCRSDTEDCQGQITELRQAPIPDRDQLQQAVASLTGTILQQPPAYSALKINGQRAYRLARQGNAVELGARPVTIHQLQLARYEYPLLELEIVCGSGTYVRSLGRDVARAVGTEAVMTALTRTAIGHLTVESAVAPSALDSQSISQYLLPPVEAVRHLPCVRLTAEQLQRITYGQAIRLSQDANRLAALTPAGQLAAVLVQSDDQLYRPRPNFVSAAPASALNLAD